MASPRTSVSVRLLVNVPNDESLAEAGDPATKKQRLSNKLPCFKALSKIARIVTLCVDVSSKPKESPSEQDIVLNGMKRKRAETLNCIPRTTVTYMSFLTSFLECFHTNELVLATLYVKKLREVVPTDFHKILNRVRIVCTCALLAAKYLNDYKDFVSEFLYTSSAGGIYELFEQLFVIPKTICFKCFTETIYDKWERQCKEGKFLNRQDGNGVRLSDFVQNLGGMLDVVNYDKYLSQFEIWFVKNNSDLFKMISFNGESFEKNMSCNCVLDSYEADVMRKLDFKLFIHHKEFENQQHIVGQDKKTVGSFLLANCFTV